MSSVRINLKDRALVCPSAETPNETLWLSNMDLVMPPIHVPYIYFYRPNTSSLDFFDSASLRSSLSHALVYFYPLAGRLKRGEDGCVAVDCNGEGAIFIEAQTDSVIDDFGDFAPTKELFNLAPQVNTTHGISSYPLLLAQMTRFKCGGVSLMVLVHHSLADGTAAFHFINTWSELARALPKPTFLPSIDRSPLAANNPPTPTHFFPHLEYQAPPSLNTPPPPQPTNSSSLTVSVFNISAQQVYVLKSKTRQATTLETLAAHVWRCACKARDLPDDQQTKLYIPVNGRTRLRPELPPGYFGNALFTAAPVASVSDLSSSLATAAGVIHGALERMDDEYLRSAVDYLQQFRSNIEKVTFGGETFRSPNLRITSWHRMPIHDADFGWGRPIFTGTGIIPFEGMCLVIPRPTSDDHGDGHDGFSLVISLRSDHMTQFGRFLFQF